MKIMTVVVEVGRTIITVIVTMMMLIVICVFIVVDFNTFIIAIMSMIINRRNLHILVGVTDIINTIAIILIVNIIVMSGCWQQGSSHPNQLMFTTRHLSGSAKTVD